MSSGERLPLAATWSPEDSPRSLRPIHGTRYSRAQWMSSRRTSSVPRGGGGRPGLVRIGGHVEAEDLAGPQRDPGVALRRQVQSVAVPGAPVLDRLEGPQVEDRTAVAVRDGPYMPVVRGDLAPQVLQHRDAAGVEAGRHHDGADGGGEVGDRALEALRDLVGVGAGPDDVVAARAEGDQVRGEFLGPPELVVDDLVEQLPAHGEVGVGEVAFRLPVREQYRETVRPTDEGSFGAGVADAFGEAVPHRHVRPDHRSVVTLRIVCHVEP